MSRAKLPRAAWTKFVRAVPVPPTEAVKQDIAAKMSIPLEDVEAVFEARLTDETWKNSRYQVVIDRDPAVTEHWPQMIHLSIKRLDRAPVHDWRELQRIKNELVGADHEAIELYPAENRVVDTANQYHLWVLAEAGRLFPFGWTVRLVQNAPTLGLARQRPRADEVTA